jgi:hypothetical protein
METLNDIIFGKKLEYLEELLKIFDFDVIFFCIKLFEQNLLIRKSI